MSEWIDVNDRFPEKGLFVAFCGKKAFSSPNSRLIIFDSDIYKKSIDGEAPSYLPINEALSVTHWMPLPNPPK